MGLDMYLYKRKSDQSNEIAYWRKHNRLHGLFEKMWRKKFPNSKNDFNCIDFHLDMEDLNKVESAIKNRLLPKTSGFFFGEDSYDYYDIEMQMSDLGAITEAIHAKSNNYEIVYTCWW
jgi:hypothetical protein